jgi:ferritin-like metal-binding protein YciE
MKRFSEPLPNKNLVWHEIFYHLYKILIMAKSNSKQKTQKNSSNAGAAVNDSMLKSFFEDELKDIYWAEKHITKALPKMKKAATSEALQAAFEEHLQQTQTHVQRLEQVFEMLGKKAQAKKCDAMAGIVEEGNGIIQETEKGTSTRDVGLILSAQKVEHYEIATYGGLAQLATTLGLDDVADVLNQTLQEEKDTDVKLTEIAESDVNYEAALEEEES